MVDKCIFRLSKSCVKILIESLFGGQTQESEDNCELSQVQLSNLILNEFANFVVKNLFNRNKQVKNAQFLDKIEESLQLINDAFVMQNKQT